jgi:ABC-type multidrug transport system fused ATPase/permease subunit
MIMIAIVFPWVLLTLLPLFGGFYFTVRYYRRSSRELKRLDGILTSPVFAHFSATMSGISVIRAYKAQERFEVEYTDKIDKNDGAWLAFEAANRWVGVRLGSFLVVVVVAHREQGSICGSCMTHSLSLPTQHYF